MFKKLFKSFSIYSLSSVISAILGLLILPILTKHLSQKDYGITALFNAYVLVLSPFLNLSSGGYFWIQFFKKENSKSDLNKLFSTYFWFVLFSLVAITIVIAFVFPFFQDYSIFSFVFILLLPLTSFLSILSDEPKNFFINSKFTISYFVYSVFITIVELGLTYYFVVYVFRSWEGRILAWICSLIMQFLFSIWLFGIKVKLISFSFDKNVLYKILNFGYPLIFHQLGKFVVNQSDRLFITKMVSIDEAGVYSIGYQIGATILLPIIAFGNYYSPFVMERLVAIDNFKKLEITKMSYTFLGFMLLFFFLQILIAPFFFDVFIDKKFEQGLEYVFWTGLAYVFWGAYLMFSSVLFYYGKTKFLGWISIFNILLNCVLNYFFILHFGAIGAAYATLVSFICIFFISAWYSNRLFPMPWLFFVNK
ncbi:MAG: polysaccharide biosynthesis C-terminal domain-containing protein [Bacteroidetes bacterium]|nr:polysaccharide biosynthesis C-terminal domain-containing protein [Bacteroidota bacterium]